MIPWEKDYLVGVVGPCAAGKTTLIKNLIQNGISARHIAQEHSYVPDMWFRISHPNILIYLDVSYPFTVIRRQLDWTIRDFDEENIRLRHARQHADLYISTDELSAPEVLAQVLKFLNIYSFPSQSH